MCSIALTDLITDYSLSEGALIQVKLTATNAYGESLLSAYVESEAKQV